jgi:hypothetical protein
MHLATVGVGLRVVCVDPDRAVEVGKRFLIAPGAAEHVACASASSVAGVLLPPLRSSVVLHAASAAAAKSSAARAAVLTLVDTRHIGPNSRA